MILFSLHFYMLIQQLTIKQSNLSEDVINEYEMQKYFRCFICTMAIKIARNQMILMNSWVCEYQKKIRKLSRKHPLNYFSTNLSKSDMHSNLRVAIAFETGTFLYDSETNRGTNTEQDYEGHSYLDPYSPETSG